MARKKSEGPLSAAAKTLGKHGGDARATSLSGERKSEIARQGAMAKHHKGAKKAAKKK